MFATFDSRHTSLERLLQTHRRLVPHARVELNNSSESFRWRGELGSANGLCWWRLKSEADWRCWLPHEEERFVLELPHSGVMGARLRGKEFLSRSGSALVLGVAETAWTQARSHSDGGNWHEGIKFDIATVRRHLARTFDGRATLHNIGLDPQLDLSTPAGQTLQHLIQAIGAGMRDEKVRSEKATALMSEAVLQLVFSGFHHRFSDQLDRYRPDATSRQIGAAVDFIRANMHEALTLGGIAEAVGVSERSLQYGFRRFFETTPLVYLRDVRLAAVHSELSSPENRLPVNEVALKWGFTHMSRFAARYRAAYGELPSETMKRTGGGDGRPRGS